MLTEFTKSGLLSIRIILEVKTIKLYENYVNKYINCIKKKNERINDKTDFAESLKTMFIILELRVVVIIYKREGRVFDPM